MSSVVVADVATKSAVLGALLGTQFNGGSILWTTAADVAICSSAFDIASVFTTTLGVSSLNKGGSVVSGSNPLDSTANAGGSATVAKAKFLKSDATLIVTFDVAVSGAVINLQNVVIANGASIRLVGFTIGVN